MNVSACSLIVVSLTIRTFNNVRPVIEQLRDEGWNIEIVWAPSRCQPGAQSPRDLGFEVVLETDWENQATNEPYRRLPPDDPFWMQFLDLVEASKPACVLCDDATNWPSLGAYETLRRLEHPPALIAAQHGLSQPWHALNASFHFDFFLAFGQQHVFMFDRERWRNVLPTGLPKLDALSDKPVCEEGYLLYMAQHFPNPTAVGDMLEGMQKHGFPDVRIRPHPGHPSVYEELRDRFKMEDPVSDPTDLIARSSAVIMPHSTAILEALILGKKVAVVPSAGLVDFPLFPWVARDYTALEIEKALVQAGSKRRSAEYDRFLGRLCGGRFFKSTDVTTNFIRFLARISPDKNIAASNLVDLLWGDPAGQQLLRNMGHPLIML
jgi:hypothetical protein